MPNSPKMLERVDTLTVLTIQLLKRSLKTGSSFSDRTDIKAGIFHGKTYLGRYGHSIEVVKITERTYLLSIRVDCLL